MSQTRENIKQEIQQLDDEQLEEIGRFIEFLKWKSQRATKSNQLESNNEQFASRSPSYLYSNFWR